MNPIVLLLIFDAFAAISGMTIYYFKRTPKSKDVKDPETHTHFPYVMKYKAVNDEIMTVWLEEDDAKTVSNCLESGQKFAYINGSDGKLDLFIPLEGFIYLKKTGNS
jgi:hypothetical protein